MTHGTRHAAGAREPRGGAWQNGPMEPEPQPRSPDGGGWVEAWEPANVRSSPASVVWPPRSGSGSTLFLQLETWAAKTRNTRRRGPRRCGLPCLLPGPEVPRPELLGKPRARSPWPGRRPPDPPAPGSPESSKVRPGPVPSLMPSHLAPCPAKNSQSRADEIDPHSFVVHARACKLSVEWPCRSV